MNKRRILSFEPWSYILLVAVVFTTFFVTLFPFEWHKGLYKFLFMVIYFSGIFNLERHRRQVIYLSLVVLLFDLISILFDMAILGLASRVLNIIFFSYIVGALVFQIARAKTVNAKVIMESINGYLLIGIVFAIVVAITAEIDPSGFNFHNTPSSGTFNPSQFSQDLYYTLITMATVGYGDMLPLKPFTRSLATMIAITGQLYVAIIIAMLVGKFASQRKD